MSRVWGARRGVRRAAGGVFVECVSDVHIVSRALATHTALPRSDRPTATRHTCTAVGVRSHIGRVIAPCLSLPSPDSSLQAPLSAERLDAINIRYSAELPNEGEAAPEPRRPACCDGPGGRARRSASRHTGVGHARFLVDNDVRVSVSLTCPANAIEPYLTFIDRRASYSSVLLAWRPISVRCENFVTCQSASPRFTISAFWSRTCVSLTCPAKT